MSKIVSVFVMPIESWDFWFWLALLETSSFLNWDNFFTIMRLYLWEFSKAFRMILHSYSHNDFDHVQQLWELLITILIYDSGHG